MNRNFNVCLFLSFCILGHANAGEQDPRMNRSQLRAQMPQDALNNRKTPSKSLKTKLNDAQIYDDFIADSNGFVEVIVELENESVAQMKIEDKSKQQAQVTRVKKTQADFLQNLRKRVGSSEMMGQTQIVGNFVVLKLLKNKLPELFKSPEVRQVTPNEKAVFQSASYGANGYTPLKSFDSAGLVPAEFDGEGVTIGIMDSGIDYTHAAFGGSGNVNDFSSNDPSVIEPGTFPTETIVGGFDFDDNDPDPLDNISPGSGHGTAVASMVLKLAPKAQLYALRIESLASMLAAIEFALDPNGDDDTSDHLDILNMSFDFPGQSGKSIGHPLNIAVENASLENVLTVAAAGNDARQAFSVNPPASAPSVLTVGASFSMEVSSVNQNSGTHKIITSDETWPVEKIHWSGEPDSTVFGQLPIRGADYGSGDGCQPYSAGVAGKSVYIRQTNACDELTIAANADQADIGLLIIEQSKSSFDYKHYTPLIAGSIATPMYRVEPIFEAFSRNDQVLDVVAVDTIPTIMLTDFSNWGPTSDLLRIKPEVVARGSNVSAAAHGTGTQFSGRSGTSFSSPYVAGLAALVLQRCREVDSADPYAPPLFYILENCTAIDIKNRIVSNSIENVFRVPGEPRNISRVGAGSASPLKALSSSLHITTLVPFTEPVDGGVSLNAESGFAFGFVDHSSNNYPLELTSQFLLKNSSDQSKNVTFSTRVTHPSQLANTAIEFDFSFASPSSTLAISPKSQQLVTFDLDLDAADFPVFSLAAKRPTWVEMENHVFEGFIDVTDTNSGEVISVPWQVFPRAASNVELLSGTVDARETESDPGTYVSTLDFINQGNKAANVAPYTVLKTFPSPTTNDNNGPVVDQSNVLKPKAVGFVTADVDTNVCASGYKIEFAIDFWKRISVLYGHSVYIDGQYQRPGETVQTFRLSANAEQVTFNGNSKPMPFLNHTAGTSAVSMGACIEDIGLTETNDSFVTPLTVAFTTMNGTFVGSYTVSLFGDDYFASRFSISPAQNLSVDFFDYKDFHNPSDSTSEGLMFVTTQALPGDVAGTSTRETEVLYLFESNATPAF